MDQLIAGKVELGNALISTQRWLNEASRDILDESDEVLSVKFELIYTMGIQKDLEFSPKRWEIVQQVLGLANRFAREISEKSPRGIEILPVCPGAELNRIRLLQDETGQGLLRLIAGNIYEKGISGLCLDLVKLDAVITIPIPH